MPIVWEPLLLIPLIVLAIPVGILIGQRWRGGPLVSLSAGATLGMLVYLALLWTSLSPATVTDANINSLAEGILFVAGAVLLLGALALAFAGALHTRRLAWAAILCALIYASFVGMLGIVLEPIRFCGDALPLACSPPDLGRFALFAALMLAGPLATVIYALFVAFQRQPRALPEGVTISRLTADEGQAGD